MKTASFIGFNRYSILITLAIGIIAFFALFISYLPTFAASTATVSATVMVQNISMTVSNNTIAWGTLPAGTASSTNPAYTNTLTNVGNVAENFLIKGQNSTGGWTLSTTAGTDKYVESSCATGCTSAPTGYTALTTTNATLASNITALTGISPLDLYIKVPTSTAIFSQQSVDVTLTAVAY